MKRFTRKEFSAGGVVYKKFGVRIEVLLIAKNTSGVWCLPKGKIEQGETHQQAAVREIKEETGVDALIIRPLDDIKYNFISLHDKAQVFKEVRFFLFEYKEGSISKHLDPDREVDDVKWFEINEAIRIMTYPSEKMIMKKALEEIKVL